MIEENANNPAALEVLARSLNLLIKIFYDLNCQDLPEFFEDNMAPFMSLLEKYMVYQNPLLVTDDEEEEGPLEQIKTNICSVLELYSSRYDESFSLLPPFVPIIVNLLTTTGNEIKYDSVSGSNDSYLHRYSIYCSWSVKPLLYCPPLFDSKHSSQSLQTLMHCKTCVKRLHFPTWPSEVRKLLRCAQKERDIYYYFNSCRWRIIWG